ncbi:hypothetical protein IA57_08920 [Mangrovimonas yunxiaonensis]|uniref:DUF3078 domain-containing protein n=1 Tax=Mangrovimonas yunxiaonensis TaxID=1197477 RepID=A0A084TIP7_9FLAO|nr:DUF3078 domain-containing protein [Mangrovimonas yunxiaonensis]KFB00583.1 hypothetical protein IA57_08920 [Mangrovimonas yunxiaonensis]GGH46998.1 hypothetical protein GCM10011364_21510 [Mangrovimonas yunxiaonensis]
MKNLFCLFVLFLSGYVYAQPDSLFFKVPGGKIEAKEGTWVHKNKAGLDISEVAFVNWNAGGSNSISALLSFESQLKYEFRHFFWTSTLLTRYGVNKQQEQEMRKTDDIIDVSSVVGYRKDTLTNWYYSARFNFKSQFTNGYHYPDKNKAISKLMAPGYLFLGGGAEYGKNIDKFSSYFSPLTLKATFVLDDELANLGSFGVRPAEYDSAGNLIREGERVRKEIGVLFTNAYETKLFENISVKHFVSLYTDYINNFGNVDIDWQVNFDFKVNDFVRATLGSHLKYDDDTKVLVETDVAGEYEEEGATVQWKQLLGVGVVVDF